MVCSWISATLRQCFSATISAFARNWKPFFADVVRRLALLLIHSSGR